jgi:LuxR family transcriptional regulator, maltose regulon positive regulatory protein
MVDAKFRPPTGRPGIVARTELVDRLRASPSVISVVAPPGYGKTTLLSQWASTHRRRHLAWVSVDRSDNDTSVLLTNAALALDKVEPIDGGVLRTLASPGAATAAHAIARIASTLASRSEPVRLVFDHAEMLDNPECRDAIAELAMRIPEGSQLAIATRDTPPLQTALLRSRREMVEIGIGDLAMNEQEAAALLEGAGVTLNDAGVAELVRRTEGWPVGLYLAALAINAGGKRTEAVAFTGDHRLMADYLQSEFLSRLPSAMVSFLTRTALLDRLSAPVCDAMLGSTGSAQVLEALESSNLLLVPLDPRREWYRYHHLFRELLSAELRRSEPALVPELHVRAADWFEGHGMAETAIDHAQAADDADRVARLVAGVAQTAYGDGRVDTARRWFGWFENRGLLVRYPQVAVLGAQVEALLGHPAAAEHWADAAERGHFEGTLPDGSPLAAWLAYLRALLCRDGVAQMRSDAEAARALLAPGSQLRGAVLTLEGTTYVLEGDIAVADPILAHAVEVATYLRAMPAAAMALAERVIVAIEGRHWDAAVTLSAQAMGVVEAGHLEDYIVAAPVYAVAARTDIHRGDIASARENVARAARLRPLLTYAIPYSAQVLLQMGHAYLELSDAAGARVVLREVRDIIRQRPALGRIPAQADELQSMLDAIRATNVGASSLTTAELRLLPLLTTYLSMPEIAERLHVSRNTVKTQAISIYRKLGVSSRSEANERIVETGLLGR